MSARALRREATTSPGLGVGCLRDNGGAFIGLVVTVMLKPCGLMLDSPHWIPIHPFCVRGRWARSGPLHSGKRLGARGSVISPRLLIDATASLLKPELP